jgi:hypothetical protein
VYAFAYGPYGPTFDAHPDGRPIGLVDALAACYGVAAATVYRITPDGSLTPIIRDAGSAYAVRYVGRPGGARLLRRRLTRPALAAWHARMAAHTRTLAGTR